MAEIIYLQHLTDPRNIDNILDKGLKGKILFGHGRFLIWFDYIARIKDTFYYTCTGKHTVNKNSVAFILSKNIIYEHVSYLLSELAMDIKTDKLLNYKIDNDSKISTNNIEIVVNEEILNIKPYLEKIIIQNEGSLNQIKKILTKYKLQNKVKIEVLQPTECNNEKIIKNYEKDLNDIHSEMIV